MINNFNLLLKSLKVEAYAYFIASIDTIEAINNTLTSNCMQTHKKLGKLDILE